MSFFKPRKVEKNYDLLSSCSWYTPDVGGLFAVLGWFLVGMILASIVVIPFMFGGSMPLSYVMLVMYPLQFVAVFTTNGVNVIRLRISGRRSGG